MDLFEFILIITSVIYAMAIAQILTGVSRLAQTDATIRWYLPHSLWIVILFVWIILVWWSIWEFRSLDWTFPKYLFVFAAPTVVFFSCSLLIPQMSNTPIIDLEAHYLRIRQLFLGSFALATIAAVLDGTVLSDEPLWFPGRIGHVVLVISVLSGLVTENKRIHVVIATLVLIALAYISITRLWNPR